MSNPKPKQKYLPLREITLTSRPLVKRAIAFSSDGDLAIAADDSVHVLIPEFPDLPSRLEAKRLKSLNNGDGNGKSPYSPSAADSDDDDCEGDENNSFARFRHSMRFGGLRAQYSEGSKHMPVSYPPLDPRINRELFTAMGVPFPYDRPGAVVKDGNGEEEDEEDDEDGLWDSEGEDGEGGGDAKGANRPFGAGYGLISGPGSTMNHVVNVAWSPSGLGVNRRPVLAILTSSGVVAMYGDGGTRDNILPRANEGMLQRRELETWVVLWGVGERLCVPGQQTMETENIQGVAWAKEIGPGQALLATVNDLREVAVLSVQTVMAESGEGLVWKVQEVARFEAKGPHPKGDMMDPDWTPSGTSFGLSWSPWDVTMQSRTCFLSFLDRNYIGFRKISVNGDWNRGDLPNITVDVADSYSKCVHLSTDAFFVWENTLWDEGHSKTVRGIMATPFHIIPFDLPLSTNVAADLQPHTAAECGTTYTDDNLVVSENPIVDLVIHPADKANRGPMPLYTLVRLSATATTPYWWETNVPESPPPNPPIPQWARDIGQKLEIAVPADMHLKRGYADSDSGSGTDNEESDDVTEPQDYNVDDDAPSELDEAVSTASNTHIIVPQGPEIHPHRFRLYGLTISPGGGTTAVLASSHSTQHPERGGWHTVKSSVFFGYRPRVPPSHTLPYHPLLMTSSSSHLTVEARLFEHLYGGGPPVHGINAIVSPDEQYLLSHQQQQEHSRLEELFHPALENQKCDLCGAKMNPPERKEGQRLGLSKCEKGHFFGTCAASGLAVQMPGITRSCGTCGLRTMRAAVLAGKVPGRRAEVLKEVGEGVCGGCGGKFLN